jgi:hypothetical protein
MVLELLVLVPELVWLALLLVPRPVLVWPALVLVPELQERAP